MPGGRCEIDPFTRQSGMAAEDAGELLYLNAELLEARDLGKNGLQLCRSIGCRLSPASECCGDHKETAGSPADLARTRRARS